MAGVLIVIVAFAAACSSSATVEEGAVDERDAAAATAEPVTPPTPEATATPEATSTPVPTATPEPTPTPVPTVTPVPDGTPAVLSGDGWTLTEAEVEPLIDFVETLHELEFVRPVRVEQSDDIGAGFAEDLEIFADDDWQLLELLGLIDEGVERDAVNEARRDRIRGVCCDADEDGLIVIVEPQATELETKVIVVHELVHALHRDHPDIVSRPGRSGGFELPSTYTATFESVAQFVAFAYLDSQPEAERLLVEPELPIVDAELAAIAGRVPGEMLDFSYFTAPAMAEAAYDALGAQGLSDLLGRPPTTTEQVIFPDRWLAEEDRVSQDRPLLPGAAQLQDEGRVDVALLGWMLEGLVDDVEIEALLREWTGDRWARYRLAPRECLGVVAEFDSLASAQQVADALQATHPSVAMVDGEPRFTFDTCAEV